MPVWAIVPAIAGLVAQGLTIARDSLDKRADGSFAVRATFPEWALEARQNQCFPNLKEGVPQHIADSCCNQLSGATVVVSGSLASGITVAGLPYDCIPLAPWIDGTGVVPYACGDDCIKYDGLTQEEYDGIKNALAST